MKASESKFNLLGSNSQYVRLPFGKFADQQVKMGVTAIDLVLQAPHIYVGSEEYCGMDDIRETLRERRLVVSVVTPMPYRYNITAKKGTMQYERTIGYYTQCIAAARELGAAALCITASGACFDTDREELIENLCRTLGILLKEAEKSRIKLLIGTVLGEESPENASTPVLISLEEVKALLDRINSPWLGAYADTHVIYACGESITEWFEVLGDRIGLIRLTDGNYHGYRVWGEGCLPMGLLGELKKAEYEGAISLQIPGERYAFSPEAADNKNREAVMQMIERNF